MTGIVSNPFFDSFSLSLDVIQAREKEGSINEMLQ